MRILGQEGTDFLTMQAIIRPAPLRKIQHGLRQIHAGQARGQGAQGIGTQACPAACIQNIQRLRRELEIIQQNLQKGRTTIRELIEFRVKFRRVIIKGHIDIGIGAAFRHFEIGTGRV